MGHIYANVMELIGATPLVEARRLNEAYGLYARILLKVEYFNPTGSVKDRAALFMIQEAMKQGKIKKGSLIVEPTSGNTGIGLAMIGTGLGMRVVLVMPDTMSLERRNLMKAYGAEIELTDGKKGMQGAIERAEELIRATPGAWMPDQFGNSANRQAHFETTGPEVWNDTDGKIDVFVAGVGTGGTISGTGKYLKQKKKNVRVIAVEPKESAVLSGQKSGSHGIQGIGAGFIPEVFDQSVIDDIVCVRTEDAIHMSRELAAYEGFLTGISSGAALWAAVEYAKQEEHRGKTVVVLLPDSADRYYSTGLFANENM